MKRSSRLLSVILIVMLVVGMFYVPENSVDYSVQTAQQQTKETINIWYTDEALTDYISSAALAFYDDTNVRVNPVLFTGPEYLETIYENSLSENTVPDLYVLGTESLEKAAMAGLAVPVQDEEQILNSLRFPQIALDAVTYKQQKFGYPFYYETAYLLYNETYLRQIAQEILFEEIGYIAAVGLEDAGTIDAGTEGENEEAGDTENVETDNGETDNIEMDNDGSGNTENAVSDNGEDGDIETDNRETSVNFIIPEGYSEPQWNDMMSAKLMEMIPDSIEDILNFADKYDAPENVENIFLWDVSDIFYNYFFAGAYMNVGGLHGDDTGMIEVYNADSIECLEVYQDLNQFFSIETKDSCYEEVLDTFMEGKSIFTIATTDAISKLDSAVKEGNFPYAYNVEALPGIDDEHEAVGLSVTDALVINGFSSHQKQANAFANYLVYKHSETMLGRTGKMPATVGEDDYVTDARDLVRQVYRESESLPKAIEFSNLWLQLELAYTKIWDGADVNDTLRELSEKLKTQVNGTPVEEEVIVMPETSEESEEADIAIPEVLEESE